ncbi:hypothetical protein G7Z17_g6038 [Cylindrodendrum hubeiense]|uniref:SWIM-type domain-containing protein n=1 Tax=Cylindrodendrum hubeiense TaxID=595255 RepID=A0A9P5HBT4_9HYPO|nr:hypothetical protein G7Z17_g6038 [Cylindrodendrum hubeiense]
MESLPSHRQFLTTLINSVSDIAPPAPSANAASPPPAPPSSTTSSPLQAIAQTQRPLLLTLHVLFPSLLLPAVDLLDRGLVTRLRRAETGGLAEDPERESVDGGNDPAAGGGDGIFLVRSLATTLTRRNRDVALSSQRYIVHLGVWNCSCASFTFDAFPSHPGPASAQDAAPQLPGQWSFGGMSLDGLSTSAGDVPCCKHLLACLLVQRWPGMLGQYVEDWSVSKEEMAGITAEM